MAGWSGFTDEDLRKMKGNSEKDDRPSSSRNNAQRQAQAQAAARRQRQAQQRGAASSAKRQTAREAEPAQRLDPSMQLGGSVNKPKDNSNSNRNYQTEESVKQNGIVESVKDKNPSEAEEARTIQSPEKEVKELNETEAMNVELENVQKFQQQQKVIEEANKQKRALLARAIEDRRKRAKAEADKLVRVQQELNHLDSLLTADVGIIRDKIEVASLEYMDAQKRYEKAETEFIAAKMDLFHKGEAKESLTEHLYTIIHQNEVRKARKLVELMEKLAMEVTPEEMELTIPAIPQLSNFTAVATLHDPTSPHNPVNLALQQEQQQQQQTSSQGNLAEQPQQQQQHESEQKQGQEQTQQHSEQKQPGEQRADETAPVSKTLPDEITSGQPHIDNTGLNTNRPEANCHENTSDSASSGATNAVSTESAAFPISGSGASDTTADSNPTQQQQVSTADSQVSDPQPTLPAGNNNKGGNSPSAPVSDGAAKQEEVIQNGDVTPAQTGGANLQTPPVQSTAKGWLHPFS